MIRIVDAESASDYRLARCLLQQYPECLGVDLEFQGFSRELDSLPRLIAIDVRYFNPLDNPVFMELIVQR